MKKIAETDYSGAIATEAMSIYESMSVMLMFGMLIIALLRFQKKKN